MAEKQKVDYNPVTAQVVLNETYAAEVTDDKELAEEAGKANAKNVDYVEALQNYESRADVETLAARRAREAGVSFEDAEFARTNDPSGVVTATSASTEDADNAGKSKRRQAKATSDAAEDKNPSTKAPEAKEDDK